MAIPKIINEPIPEPVISPEIIVPKKNIIFDATLMSTLTSCPRLADLRFNHRFESINGKSNNLECGSLAHKILEEFYKGQLQGWSRDTAIGNAMTAGLLYVSGCPSCADFTPTDEIPRPECNHQPNEYPGLQNTPPDNEAKPKKTGYKWVLETMDQYFKHYANDTWEPISVEQVVSRDIYEDDEIRVLWKAKLDVLIKTDAGIRPMDHKTMSQDRDTTKMHNQFIGQCFVMETRNMIVNKIGFQLSKKPEEKFRRVMHNYTADNLLEWQTEIVPYWAYQLLSYQEGYYPPRWNNCENKFGKCQFLQVCESDRGMREEELRIGFKVGPEWDPINP